MTASLICVGAGAVGLEFADIFHALGAEVEVLEMMDRPLPLFDADASAELNRVFSRKGIRIATGVRVEEISQGGKGLQVRYTGPKGEQTISAENVLIAAGRVPITEGLNLEAAGVATERGGIVVDDQMRTSVPHIYAIGDVTRKFLLAHVASRQGEVAAETIAGHKARMSYKAVPSCVYTEPEVATVGLTEAEAREKHGENVRVGKFPFRILGKAIASNEREGWVKIVSESRYGEVLGVHMVGAGVTDMIAEATLAIELESTVEDLIHTIHAHPTMPEAVLEAALDSEGRAIHKA
jgi:dihydrolipoamide dehydrogenase